MKQRLRLWGLALLLCGTAFFLFYTHRPAVAQEENDPPLPLLVGSVRDRQGQPVGRATVLLWQGAPGATPEAEAEPLASVTTQPDGRYAIPLPEPLPAGEVYYLAIERAHFEDARITLDPDMVAQVEEEGSVVLPELVLPREVNLAFWIATLIFAGMLAVVAISDLHNTLVALLGASLVFAVSYLGHPLSEDLFIFDFDTALEYIDWNVIFLVMGMMIVIAVVEETGLFQWLAFAAYRLSRGKAWLLLTVLMLVAGVASAFLDNVTTMLLMTPISVQIALALNLNPLTLLVPEVMASNVIGVSTLVGTPTNILIGSFASISFNDFLRNLTPGVLLAFAGLVIYSVYSYRRDLGTTGEMSPALLERLEERAQITRPGHLRKAGWIGAIMLLLFVFGERIHLLPSVTALMGATALLIWIRPDVEKMIDAVDWTTLVFFMALFIVVGAIQEVGLISVIADVIGRLVGDSLVLTMVTVIWVSAVLSAVVANIPFTAAMLPVVGYLSGIVPGAHSKVLFYCLSVGSAMGGNGTLIGASANLVTAGIAERAGYPITYTYFLRKGFPALVITVALATIWLFIRFLVLA